MFANTFFKLSTYALVVFVMIAGVHISQEIFAIDMLTASTLLGLEGNTPPPCVETEKLTNRCCEGDRTSKNFCRHKKVAAMATNTNWHNSVNCPSTYNDKVFSRKVSFDL